MEHRVPPGPFGNLLLGSIPEIVRPDRISVANTLHEAILGSEVTVPTLKGRVSLRIPADTQNGRTIRLAGQGMPRAGGGSGDLFVTVKLVLPTKLTDTEREYIQKIAAAHDEDVRAHLL